MIVRQAHTDEKVFRNRRNYEKQRNLSTFYMTRDTIMDNHYDNCSSYSDVFMSHFLCISLPAKILPFKISRIRNNMRRLQREIYNLNKWRSENSLQEKKIKDYDRVIEQLKKQVADQNDMITKMVYGSRRKKPRRR